MDQEPTVTMAFEEEEENVHRMLPAANKLTLRLRKVKKEAIAASLSDLASDIQDILEATKVPSDRIALRQVAIAVRCNAEGGITWIGYAKAGVENSMILTFEVSAQE